MKPVEVKPVKYIDFNKEKTKKASKFKINDHMKISKILKIFWKRLCSKLV